ncbi:sulfur carrier protein ThiS [Aeromicrobium sp. Sec7.5]|uniref:sulfur carrier protein ThiS n=1 Tax=Aeromicrobium sp. Sec7.5 TaxID=3121276 RepID=UPI002FE4B067
MPLTLNGEPFDELAETVADLVRSHLTDSGPRGVAVAVNAAVVPRSEWSRHRLVDGDAVEVVTAVQGG